MTIAVHTDTVPRQHKTSRSQTSIMLPCVHVQYHCTYHFYGNLYDVTNVRWSRVFSLAESSHISDILKARHPNRLYIITYRYLTGIRTDTVYFVKIHIAYSSDICIKLYSVFLYRSSFSLNLNL